MIIDTITKTEVININKYACDTCLVPMPYRLRCNACLQDCCRSCIKDIYGCFVDDDTQSLCPECTKSVSSYLEKRRILTAELENLDSEWVESRKQK